MPYTTMTIDEIAALPVAELADSHGAALFLWTTNYYLPTAFAVMAAWGFAYFKTVIWHKTGNPAPFGGELGPNHAEFVLAGRRGTVRQGRLKSNVIAAPARNRGGHSTKPDVFLDLIEKVSPGPYCELFARRARFGWDYWGDESLNTAEMPSAAAVVPQSRRSNVLGR